MAKKLRVGILFGGRSGEHEVSLLSAASVLNSIDREKFEVVPIGITKEGRWLAAGDANDLLEGSDSSVARRLRAGDPEATPSAKLLHEGIPTLMAPMPGPQGPEGKAIDVVFPVLHGTFGESGDPEATPSAKLLHEGIPTLMAPMPGPQGPEGKAIDVVFPVLHGTFGED